MRTIVRLVLILLLATAAPEQTGGTDTSTTATVTGSTAATATSSTAATATGSTAGSSTASTAAPTSSTATAAPASITTATASSTTMTPASNTIATSASSTTATSASNTTVTSASSTTMTPASNTIATSASSITATPASNTIATSASNTTATPASNATAAPASNTTAVTSTTTGAPVPVTSIIQMELNCSLSQNFTSDLSDSSSAGFKNLSGNVEAQFNATYLKSYPTSFRGYKVKRFWPGSVVQNGELTFSNTSTVPSNAEIAQVLRTAVQNGDVTLPVNTTTISVNLKQVINPTSSTTKSGGLVFWGVTIAPAVLLVCLTEGLFPLRVFA